MYVANGPGNPEQGRPWASGMSFYLNQYDHRSEVKYGDVLTKELVESLDEAGKAVVETMLEAGVLVPVKPAKPPKE